MNPQATRPQSCNHLHLFAASVAAHQNFVIVGITYRQAWRAVVVGGAARNPISANLVATQRLGDYLCVYEQGRFALRLRCCKQMTTICVALCVDDPSKFAPSWRHVATILGRVLFEIVHD